MVALLDHREASDCYQSELFRDGGHRVVVCRDSSQWIFQQKTRDGNPAGPRWVGIGYFTTRKALTRAWPGKLGRIHPDLQRLPRDLKRRTV